MSRAREIRVTEIRRRLAEYIVEPFVDSYYTCPESRRPTAKQLVDEIMKEIEPAIQQVKTSLEKSRPNLSENYLGPQA